MTGHVLAELWTSSGVYMCTRIISWGVTWPECEYPLSGAEFMDSWGFYRDLPRRPGNVTFYEKLQR